MPIEIPAGETYQFDVVVFGSSPGDQQMDFDLYLDSQKSLFVERIHYPLKVVESGRSQPDWIKPTDTPAATENSKPAETSNPAETSKPMVTTASSEIVSDSDLSQVAGPDNNQ